MVKRTILFWGMICFAFVPGLYANGQAEKEADAVVTSIHLAWWTNEERTAVTLETIAAYEEQHPDVKILPEYTGWGGYWDKLATQIAASDTPDVFQLVQERFSEYVYGQVITPLDSYDMDFDKVDTAAIHSWSLDGKTYGLPLGLNSWVAAYNPAIFQQAGIDPPSPDWTWSDFEGIANRIKEKTGLYGVSYVQLSQDIAVLARSAGYNLYAPDGKSWGFTDYSFLTDYFLMYSRLHESGALIEETFTQENFNNWAANPISFGEAAMCFIPSNQAAPVSEGLGKAVPFLTLPGVAERKAQILSASLAFSLAEDSEQKEVAADFINYFATDPEALTICKANRGVPATAEARTYMLDKGLDPSLAEVFSIIDVASPISSPVEWITNPKTGELNELVDEVWTKVMFQVLTPKEGASEIYRLGNDILSRS